MAGANDRGEQWVGGYVREVGTGPTRHRVYVIRRMVGGKRYEVSTRQSGEAEAMVELVRFQKNPAGYEPTPEPDLLGDEGPQPLYLDSVLSERYLDDCAEGLTKKYWRFKKKLIAWWLVNLAGKDLRKLDLTLDVLPHIPADAKSRAPKIATLKHFFSWMANVEGGNLINQTENVLLGITVPQSEPAQDAKPKTFSKKYLNAALGELKKMGKPDHADALFVLAATGWHVTELDRLAHGLPGTGIEALPAGRTPKPQKKGKGKVGKGKSGKGKKVTAKTKKTKPTKQKPPNQVLLTIHKVGKAPHRTEVGPEAVKAAQRLIARGAVPANLTRIMGKVNLALHYGADERVLPGRARHSLATSAVNKGATIQAVAEFLGHRSASTTKRFYATMAVPKKVPSMV